MKNGNRYMKQSALLLCALFFSLTGCGVQSGTNTDTITLNVVTMFGEGDVKGQVYQKINRLFIENKSNIIINDASEVSTESWKGRVTESFLNGAEPDVLFFFTDANAAEIMTLEPFVTVDEIRRVYPEYGRDIKADALQAVAAPDGEVYALPLTGYYEGLFCNLDLFEMYNLELPVTWDSFLKAVAVFRDNGIVPVAVSFSDVPHYWIEHLILSQGGVEEHHLNPTEEVPQSWIDGLAYLKMLNDMGAFPRAGMVADNNEASAMFINKEAAMILDGSWFVNSVQDKDNTTLLPFPVVPGGHKDKSDIIAGFSSGFYITKKAWNDKDKRDAAVQFVMKHTASASIARYWWGVGTPAAQCMNPVGMQRLQNDGAQMAADAKRMDAAIDSRLSPEAWQYLTGQIPAVVDGSRNPAQVLEETILRNVK